MWDCQKSTLAQLSRWFLTRHEGTLMFASYKVVAVDDDQRYLAQVTGALGLSEFLCVRRFLDLSLSAARG